MRKTSENEQAKEPAKMAQTLVETLDGIRKNLDGLTTGMKSLGDTLASKSDRTDLEQLSTAAKGITGKLESLESKIVDVVKDRGAPSAPSEQDFSGYLDQHVASCPNCQGELEKRGYVRRTERAEETKATEGRISELPT